MPFEQLAVDARAVVEALEVRGAGELEQVAVAGLVLREQGEVEGRARGGAAVEAAAGRDVALEADDRLDLVGARFLVELDGAVQVAMVGDGEGILAERLRARDEIRDGAEPVQQ